MSDNHSQEGLLAPEGGEISPVEQPSSDSAADTVSDPANQGPKTAEDGVKEDMFVDCPDEIENSESQQNSEEKEIIRDNHFHESGGINTKHLIAEEEKTAYTRELRHLLHKLQVANEQQVSPSENVLGLVNHLQSENGAWDENTSEYGASLHEMITECTRLINDALDERAQTDEKVKELHSVLLMKDQEIDLLNAKVVELGKDQHTEEVVNRLLSSLSVTLHQEELVEGEFAEKLSNVEQSVAFLVEKYKFFLSETDQLRACLTAVGTDVNMVDEIETFVIAHDKIFELRRTEETLFQNVSYLEDENRKLLEQLKEEQSHAESARGEIQKLSVGLELEKNRYANTKEKLSMAVTKGKALVQQRDSLKLSLGEKTSELEKCLVELQEKSGALEAASALQESIDEKDMILQKCKEILSEGVSVAELQPIDIPEKLSYLADENKSLKSLSLQYHELTDALSVFTFPEAVFSDKLAVRVHWLAESFHLSKEEAMKSQNEIAATKAAANAEIDLLTTSILAEMQEKFYIQSVLEDLTNDCEAQKKLLHELSETREAAYNSIDLLNTSLLAESQEKKHLQNELENLKNKYEVIVQKENHLSTEKDKILSLLLEASGFTKGDWKENFNEKSEPIAIIDECLAKIKIEACNLESFDVTTKIFERFQSLLYIRDQEMMLYELIIEEDMLDRSEANQLSNEIQRMIQKFNALNDDKANIQRSHDQLEEKCTSLREKLSMAVKKGKGLFQERENLKGSLSEKDTKIDRLRSELQLNLIKYDECQDQINKLSLIVSRVPELETELSDTKERADQLKQFLTESNSMLQKVLEPLENIEAPTDLVFEEPAEKLKWFAGYLREHDIMKMEMEQELRNVKDEVSSLVNKLAEAQTVTKSLEDALSKAENSVSLLLDEKKEFTEYKALLEDELQKEKEEASIQNTKFEEVSVGKRKLEDALSLAENSISRITNDRDIAEESRTNTEEKLQKLKQEFSVHFSKLADADTTIRALEVALSEAQKNVFLLTEENSKVQIGMTDIDNEAKKFREETDSLSRKLADASTTIKSLEDALEHAENEIRNHVHHKKNAEQEVVELNSKLKSCFEELAGIRDSKECLSLEISGQLRSFQFLLKDETLSTLLEQCFYKKIEDLKKMDVLLKDMDIFRELSSDMLQNGLVLEDVSSMSTTLSNFDSTLNMDMSNNISNELDNESIVFHIPTMIEKLQLKEKMMTDRIEVFSSFMDDLVAALLSRLNVTKDRSIIVAKYIRTLNQQLKDMNASQERHENIIKSLEHDIRTILSTCTDVSEDLEMNAEKSISELRSIQEFVKYDDKMSLGIEQVGDNSSVVLSSSNTNPIEMLTLAARHNQDLSHQFLDVINKCASITKDIQDKIRVTELTCEEAREERDQHKAKISELETDLESLQKSYLELKIELDDFQGKDDNLKEREIELSTSLSKVKELEDSHISVSQIKSILHRINDVEIPDTTFSVQDEEPDVSSAIRKLFYVIDGFNGSTQKVIALSSEKEELQSTIQKRILEIEFLKKKIEDLTDSEKVSSKTAYELLELQSGLQDIVQKLGGDDLLDNHKVAEEKWLLPLLDELVMTSMLESSNLKSKNEELGAKLLGTQKLVDDLSNKVRLLEDSNHARIAPLEKDLDGGTSMNTLSTQSEISEVQDMGALGKSNNNPLVSSAAHVRTMREGSSDHLAISIDSESERLINSERSDEDKGHIFKSLNTSGLIPRQGRIAADRIDGLWVSGSRALMSHPRGRLGLFAYWVALHIWLLASIL